MKSIPEATPILLRADERLKAEHRKRQRARIILMASDGAATRAIVRTVGCTIGTASKWRVRFAAKRMAGLDDTGERAAKLNTGLRTTRVSLRFSTRSHPQATPTGLGQGHGLELSPNFGDGRAGQAAAVMG